MSARHKLNSVNMHFCAMMAGLVGLLMGSWSWFALAAIVSWPPRSTPATSACGRPADLPGRAADGADQDQCDGPEPGPRDGPRRDVSPRHRKPCGQSSTMPRPGVSDPGCGRGRAAPLF